MKGKLSIRNGDHRVVVWMLHIIMQCFGKNERSSHSLSLAQGKGNFGNVKLKYKIFIDFPYENQVLTIRK